MNGFARGIRRLTSDALLLAALIALLGSSARAQTAEADIIKVPLPAGRSYPIHTAVPVTRVSVANPAVADVVVIGERDVVVNARTAGETDVIMWMGDTRRHYRVIVNPPTDRRQVSLGIVFAEVRKDALLQFGLSALYRDSHVRAGTGIFNNDGPIDPINGRRHDSDGEQFLHGAHGLRLGQSPGVHPGGAEQGQRAHPRAAEPHDRQSPGGKFSRRR